MANEKIEQRINLKFLVKLKKTPTECLQLLKEVYEDTCMSRAMVFMWHKRFSGGREAVEDDEREGRPSTSKTDENVEKITEIIRKDRRLSVRMLAEMVNINRETVRQILHNELNMQKVCAKMVPKNLTQDQKDARKESCTDILERLNEDPHLLERVITCDETWIFQYDPETKRQSMHWKSPSSPKIKKAKMSKSRLKAMLIVFFDIKGVILIEWVPAGQTVNQAYYKTVLQKLRERVRKKRPDLWKNNAWILHQDNAPAHTALSVKQFLADNKIPVLNHPPYSPDLAPCDFYLFPKVKESLKGTHFETLEQVKDKTATLLRSITPEDFQNCYQHWQKRMQRCIFREGEYFEGEHC